MSDEIQAWVMRFLEGAFETIATQTLILGLFGATLSVFAVLVFKIGTNAAFGEVKGKWLGTWRAIWILCLLTLPGAGFVIGGGEGFIRGSETALRESEFGRTTVPALSEQSVYLYAAVYYADPQMLKEGRLGAVGGLETLSEVRNFAQGNGRLETARLNERMKDLSGVKLSQMAANAQEDFAKLTPVLGDDFKGIQTASKMMMEFAVAPSDVDGMSGADLGPLFDVEQAAALHGDPASVTRDELAEHLRERVAIPGLLMPIKVLIRPWQFGAALMMGLLLLLLLVTRLSIAEPSEPRRTGQAS